VHKIEIKGRPLNADLHNVEYRKYMFLGILQRRMKVVQHSKKRHGMHERGSLSKDKGRKKEGARQREGYEMREDGARQREGYEMREDGARQREGY
jgi:hypothetical protein